MRDFDFVKDNVLVLDGVGDLVEVWDLLVDRVGVFVCEDDGVSVSLDVDVPVEVLDGVFVGEDV